MPPEQPTSLMDYLKSHRILILAGSIIFLLVLLISIYMLVSSRQDTKPPVIIGPTTAPQISSPPKPTVSTLPTTSPTISLLNQLTTSEKNYPNYPPQHYEVYPGTAKEGAGTLIVTSNPSPVEVNLVPPGPDVPYESLDGTPEMIIPRKYTPFKISNLPAGKYFLEAIKRGYARDYATVIVEKDKITRTEIKMKPYSTGD